ncbi:hypothetical protein [Roseibium polysiphoniae]|uniref:DUF3618 domain-containing protein n=1 Tax=Roseibium polysiphoniae TaxID=2571221 RepID=A0ABR9C9N6_9HYPH|nr:hypothetical protein [Roseibium polysiphoniae]MBD8876626.1 hypothetical protein [Roseibium polysiphoniae]
MKTKQDLSPDALESELEDTRRKIAALASIATEQLAPRAVAARAIKAETRRRADRYVGNAKSVLGSHPVASALAFCSLGAMIYLGVRDHNGRKSDRLSGSTS